MYYYMCMNLAVYVCTDPSLMGFSYFISRHSRLLCAPHRLRTISAHCNRRTSCVCVSCIDAVRGPHPHLDVDTAIVYEIRADRKWVAARYWKLGMGIWNDDSKRYRDCLLTCGADALQLGQTTERESIVMDARIGFQMELKMNYLLCTMWATFFTISRCVC